MACTMLARKAFVAAPARPTRSVRMVVRASVKPELPKVVKPAVVAAVSNLIMALPSFAESGKLFDFNLTLPVMAGEILLLMVFLEKFWFTPVGKVLDERDALLRSQLSTVKDGSAELDALTKEAEDLVKAARAEVSSLVNSQKSAKQAELDKIYAEAKAKVTTESEAAIAAMEKESESLLASLDAQAEKIAGEVLKRVLPEGVKV
jgi:F-type H+-transporting ATPase subunit b